MSAKPKTLTVTSWNVNSIKARAERVLDWIDAHQPDVLCMQEIKVTDDKFPADAFEERGYHVETFGQKTYNGVAIAAKEPLTKVDRGLPHDPDESQSRVIAAQIAGLRVINVYVPNGKAVGDPKYDYKLAWLAQFQAMLQKQYAPTDKLLICGDFNIAPDERDVWDPEYWDGRVLFSGPEREALRRLLDWGLVDAFRLHEDGAGLYTWWDYRGGAFRRNWGLRIDHHLMTQPLAKRCTAVTIDRDERKARPKQPDLKASDHVPITAGLRLS